MNHLKAIFNWKHPCLSDPNNPVSVWLHLINVTFISMLVIIDLLSSVVITEQMQGFLEIDSTRTEWIGKSFFFASALAPLYSIHMANLYGYKRMLFLGNVIFSIGAIGTGFAPNYIAMLFFRFLGGMGGGIVMAVSLNIINHTVPENERRTAITAYNNLYFGLGIFLGLLLGGYFGQAGEWRLVFLMNMCFSLPTLLLTWILIPETDPIKVRPYDFFGFFCILVFFLTLLLLVTQAKAPWNTLGFRSPFIHGCYFVMLITLAAFLLHSYRNPCALIDLNLFSRVRFCISCAGLIIVGLMVFGVTIELMIILQNDFQYEYWVLGKFVSVVGLIYLLCGIITTLFSKMIYPRVFIFIGLILIAISCFLHQLITIQSPPSQIGALIVLRSVGIGLVLGPITGLALAPFDNKLDVSHAAALATFFRQMGATFGSSIIALIIQLRTPYHTLRFGESVDIYAASFRRYYHEFNIRLSEAIGQGQYLGQKQSHELIADQIRSQAEIASLNDAIFILGFATIAIGVLMVALTLGRFYCTLTEKNKIAH